jgi:hypothetical protein
MRKLLLIVLAAAAAYYAYTSQIRQTSLSTEQPVAGEVGETATMVAAAAAESSKTLKHAFEHRQDSVQVQAAGVVDKLLPDDNDGSRHQRFLLRLASGQTVLIAYNVDIAPRIESLAVGDPVIAYGEYEWNNKGGILHWTHSDPAGRHVAGWIKHRGKTYQ